jgi:hypothetical protein
MFPAQRSGLAIGNCAGEGFVRNGGVGEAVGIKPEKKTKSFCCLRIRLRMVGSDSKKSKTKT